MADATQTTLASFVEFGWTSVAAVTRRSLGIDADVPLDRDDRMAVARAAARFKINDDDAANAVMRGWSPKAHAAENAIHNPTVGFCSQIFDKKLLLARRACSVQRNRSMDTRLSASVHQNCNQYISDVAASVSAGVPLGFALAPIQSGLQARFQMSEQELVSNEMAELANTAVLYDVDMAASTDLRHCLHKTFADALDATTTDKQIAELYQEYGLFYVSRGHFGGKQLVQCRVSGQRCDTTEQLSAAILASYRSALVEVDVDMAGMITQGVRNFAQTVDARVSTIGGALPATGNFYGWLVDVCEAPALVGAEYQPLYALVGDPDRQVQFQRVWTKVASGILLFGRAEWELHIGRVEDEPPFPPNLCTILQQPSPLMRGRVVRETHILVLIPRQVDGATLSLPVLQTALAGRNLQHLLHMCVEENDWEVPIATSWVLMPRDCFRDFSFGTSFITKLRTVEGASIGNLRYHIPSATEATACILALSLCTGDRLFRNCSFYTSDFVEGCTPQPVVVGHFRARGLTVRKGRTSRWSSSTVIGIARLS